MNIQDKVIVITGASAGVGAACARMLVQRGARLMLAARGKDNLDAIAAELDAPDRLQVLPCDVANPADCENLIRAARDAFGRIDVLINNAGCNYRGGVGEVGAMRLAQIVDVNLRAPIILSALVEPEMLQRGSGAIINVASLAGRVPLPHEATYSATKWGLRGFSFSMAEELRGTGLSVSVVCPGPIETGFILTEIDTVPDLVFSQPMSSAETVARAIIACIEDGRRERVVPAVSRPLTTLSYLMPSLFRALRPAFERKGAKAKKRYIAARS